MDRIDFRPSDFMKYILVVIPGQEGPVLIVRDNEMTHNDILNEFIDKHGISHPKLSGNWLTEKFKPSAAIWSVTAGKINVDKRGKVIIVFGDSMMFDGADHDIAAAILRSSFLAEGFKVEVQ